MPNKRTVNVTLIQAMLEFPQFLFREEKSNSTKDAYMNDFNHFKEFLTITLK